MLQDADPYVRRDACFAVSESRRCDLVPLLVDVLKDEDAGVKEAALNALVTIGGKEVAEAVRPMVSLEDAALRNLAIEILQQVGFDALETISSMLNDPDDDVVKFAIDIMAGIKEADCAILLAPLSRHANPNVRGSVAVCLGKTGSRGSAPVLLDILNDTEEWVRFSAVEGLGLLGEPSALGPLLEIIEKESGLVREAAIDAASRIASVSEASLVLNKICGLVKKGLVMDIQPVVSLLEKAVSPGSFFKPDDEFIYAYYGLLSAAMSEPSRGTQLRVVKGIGLLCVPEGLKKVFEFIDSLKEIDEDAEMVLVDAVVSIIGKGPLPQLVGDELKKVNKCFSVIVKAVSILRLESAVPVLEELLHSVGKQQLREVVSAIEAIGSMDSVNVFYNALKSNDGHTRKTSARALASLAGESAAPCLFDALRAECYRDVQEEITDVLAVIPSDSVKKGFYEMLSDGREHLREMGARGLGMIGDEAVIEHLKKAAKDPSPAVRKAAYRSMAKLGIPDAVEAVVEGLKDGDDDVKLAVLKALGGWTGRLIKDALVEVVKDGNLWVRYHAVNLIGELGERDTEALLLGLLANDAPPVKAAAASALGKCGSAESIKELEGFASHPDPKVMEAVHEAIESLRCLL